MNGTITGPRMFNRPASAKSSAITSEGTHASPSDVALFLTNLRLLDLDKRDDWPDISVSTFYAKNGQQDHKHRIRGVEWALYRLFELWDVKEARAKLDPFFPPLEPLQSLNLRAALYRCLNQLKKNGVLGREVSLRKSILDECKGDKLEELLVSFSTIVLKKKIVSDQRGGWKSSIALQLAMAPTLDYREVELMRHLTLAYRASLSTLLKTKRERHSAYRDANKLLRSKNQQIRERKAHCKAVLSDERLVQANPAEVNRIRQQVQDNWTADPQWLECILRGGEPINADVVLKLPFEQFWAQISGKDRSADEENPRGLLEDLHHKVNEQRDRLERWRAFLSGAKGAHQPSQISPNRVINERKAPAAQFCAHQDLRLKLVTATSPTDPPKSHLDKSQTGRRYQEIITEMRERLSKASLSQQRGGTGWSATPVPIETPLLPTNPMDQIALVINPSGKAQDALPDSRMSTSRPSPRHSKSPKSTSDAVKSQSDHRLPKKDADDCVTNGKLSGADIDVVDEAPGEAVDKLLEEEISAGEMMRFAAADGASITESGLSDPNRSRVKPRHLSLMERTRMSMIGLYDVEILEDRPSSKLDTNLETPTTPAVPAMPSGGRADLLERTRQSISLLPLTRSKPKAKPSARRKTREPHFPVNQFEAPPRQQSPGEAGSADSTPHDHLFAEDVEYASVFKSRPKIATSPVLTPRDDWVASHIEDYVEAQGQDSPSERNSSLAGMSDVGKHGRS